MRPIILALLMTFTALACNPKPVDSAVLDTGATSGSKLRFRVSLDKDSGRLMLKRPAADSGYVIQSVESIKINDAKMRKTIGVVTTAAAGTLLGRITVDLDMRVNRGSDLLRCRTGTEGMQVDVDTDLTCEAQTLGGIQAEEQQRCTDRKGIFSASDNSCTCTETGEDKGTKHKFDRSKAPASVHGDCKDFWRWRQMSESCTKAGTSTSLKNADSENATCTCTAASNESELVIKLTDQLQLARGVEGSKRAASVDLGKVCSSRRANVDKCTEERGFTFKGKEGGCVCMAGSERGRPINVEGILGDSSNKLSCDDIRQMQIDCARSGGSLTPDSTMAFCEKRGRKHELISFPTRKAMHDAIGAPPKATETGSSGSASSTRTDGKMGATPSGTDKDSSLEVYVRMSIGVDDKGVEALVLDVKGDKKGGALPSGVTATYRVNSISKTDAKESSGMEYTFDLEKANVEVVGQSGDKVYRGTCDSVDFDYKPCVLAKEKP